MPVLADCNGLRAAFNGTPNTMHLVTTHSWAEGARGYPRVVEYRVLPQPGGGVRLMLSESVYYGPASTAQLCPGNSAPAASASTIELAANLEYCRFVYHEALQSLDAGAWSPVWDRPNLPSAVRVEMASRESNASRLPMATLHIPIHVNRDVLAAYVDQQ